MCNVSGDSSRQFSNVATVVVTVDGVYSVQMASLLDGPIEALSGTLTAITAPVTGWSAVTNPLDAIPGHFLETDPDYRERQREELAASGSSTVDAITAKPLQIPGVVSAFTLENNTDVTNSLGSSTAILIECIVWDGSRRWHPCASSATIAQVVIMGAKPSGAATFGTTAGYGRGCSG